MAEREPLVSAPEIMHMYGEVIMSTMGLPPLRAALQPYDRDPRLVKRLAAAERELITITDDMRVADYAVLTAAKQTMRDERDVTVRA